MSFFYCQRQIEDKSKCEEQCEHCKEYYKPLEINQMKPILSSQLKPGDIFAYEIKLHGREAFEYLKKAGKRALVKSRTSFKELKKELPQYVILLRCED